MLAIILLSLTDSEDTESEALANIPLLLSLHSAVKCILLCLSTVCGHVNVGFFSWSRWTLRHYERHFRDTVLLGELLEMRRKSHYNQPLDDIPPDFPAENCSLVLKLAPKIGIHQLQILSVGSPVKFKLLLLAAKPQKGNIILVIRRERPFTQVVLQVSPIRKYHMQ